jgi:hypothetical protein
VPCKAKWFRLISKQASIKTAVLGLRPKLQGFYMSGPVTHPNRPNKEMCNSKGKEKKFIIHYGHIVGRGKASISTHFQGIHMSCRFKYRKD